MVWKLFQNPSTPSLIWLTFEYTYFYSTFLSPALTIIINTLHAIGDGSLFVNNAAFIKPITSIQINECRSYFHHRKTKIYLKLYLKKMSRNLLYSSTFFIAYLFLMDYNYNMMLFYYFKCRLN